MFQVVWHQREKKGKEAGFTNVWHTHERMGQFAFPSLHFIHPNSCLQQVARLLPANKTHSKRLNGGESDACPCI